jgi:hypothetical protein
MWWNVFVTPAHGKLRQEDHQFEAGLSYTVRLLSKQNKAKQKSDKGFVATTL